MGFDAYKFVIPADALKVETELNIGYCKEIQNGLIETFGGAFDPKQAYTTVDWDNCTTLVSFSENPEDTILDISKCRGEKGYDMSHDCQDGIQDISKCMEGNIAYHFVFEISIKYLSFNCIIHND